MTPLELGVMLSEQMETNNAVNMRIPDCDVASRRTHLVDINKTLRQSEQNVSVAPVRAKHYRNGKAWTKPVKQLVQMLACLNLSWRLAL